MVKKVYWSIWREGRNNPSTFFGTQAEVAMHLAKVYPWATIEAYTDEIHVVDTSRPKHSQVFCRAVVS